MKVPTTKIKKLRELSGAGIMECRNVLLEVEGDVEKAFQCLREVGLIKAEKKSDACGQSGDY